MKNKEGDGNEVLQESGLESLFDAGFESLRGSSKPDSNDINNLIHLLTTKKGRKMIRKVLGSPLPNCEEEEEEEEEC